ncbi:MAG: 16S rRNA (cytidine(1402)-2'-O)-methyltransferase [Propionibacteriaceae bacterium]|jgi:16S rRNA (cytidine1402-2'-O)-methyltransferase|nr:16S rRNA (cytidine(1402)-2'-O)-methyltransferase [Propionibacteriaceae bacterium]
MNPSTGLLLLAGTPIGDSRYVSEALRQGLLTADVIAAEDTRKFADLCRRAEVRPQARVVSYFEGNEAQRTPSLIADMESGSVVVLVTDAGMPSVSDPGFRLVTACIEKGISVSAIPGPSAVLTALALSGLNTDRFCFEGFLPRKQGQRRTRLQGLAAEDRTMVFFEAPHRLHDFLSDATEILGPDRRAAICRELTKTYEEVIRNDLASLATWSEREVRGEITIVVAGALPLTPDIDDLVNQVNTLLASGIKRTAAVAQVSARTGADRHELYDAVLKSTQD